jgi:predicted SAM-dependent methyltransferase
MPLISTGTRSAWRELRHELAIQRRHIGAVRNARRLHGQSRLKLHLGCGPKRRAGWINIDLQKAADLQLDVREDFPFEAGTASIIYSEHFLEHLEYPTEVAHVLRESLRVLEPGGLFSVGVPDAGEVLLQYAGGELPALMQEWSRDKDLQWFPPWVWATPMHLVNFFFRQGRDHKYAYDFETLARVLKEAGFPDVTRRDFDPRSDSEDRREGTLYVDARKAGHSELPGGRV